MTQELSLAAAAAGLMLTCVRAGWLAAVVGLVLVALLARRGRAALMVIFLIGLLAGLVFGLGIIDVRSLTERLQADQPIEYRLGAISTGLEIARRSPLIGLGLDNFSDAAIASGWQPTGRFGVLAVAPHNLFIYLMTSGGFLALVPFLTVLASIGLYFFGAIRRGGVAPPVVAPTRSGTSSARDWAIAGLAMLVEYVIISNTYDAAVAQLANMVFFVTLGAAYAAIELERAAVLAAASSEPAA